MPQAVEKLCFHHEELLPVRKQCFAAPNPDYLTSFDDSFEERSTQFTARVREKGGTYWEPIGYRNRRFFSQETVTEQGPRRECQSQEQQPEQNVGGAESEEGGRLASGRPVSPP